MTRSFRFLVALTLPAVLMAANPTRADSHLHELRGGGPVAEESGGRGWYVSDAFGTSWLLDPDAGGTITTENRSYLSGNALTTAVGRYFGRSFRVEGAIAGGHTTPDDTGRPQTLSLMGSIHYEPSWTLGGLEAKPFIGAGIGASRATFDGVTLGMTTPGDEDWTLAYRAEAGLAFEFTPRTTVSVEYHYFGSGQPLSPPAGETDEPRGHSLLFGLRYGF